MIEVVVDGPVNPLHVATIVGGGEPAGLYVSENHRTGKTRVRVLDDDSITERRLRDAIAQQDLEWSPPPVEPPPDPKAVRRAAIEAATDLESLKAALLMEES